MIRYCKHCGTLLEEEVTACPFCGVTLAAPKEVTKNKTRYCKHCGTYLTSDADTCFFCGADLKQQKTEQKPQSVSEESSGTTTDEMSAAVVEPTSEATEEASSKTITRLNWRTLRKKITKKQLFIAGGVLLGVIAIVVCLSLLFSSPNEAVDKYSRFINGDINAMDTLAPQAYWEYLGSQRDMTADQYLSNQRQSYQKTLENIMENYTRTYGEDFSITLKVVDREKVNKEDLDGIRDALEKKYGIKSYRVSSAENLILKIVYKGSEYESIRATNMTAVKIDNDWFLISYSRNSETGTYNAYFNVMII